MLQISLHIVYLDDAITDFDCVTIYFLFLMDQLRVNRAVVKVHASSMSLNHIDNFELSKSSHISVVVFIHL